MANMDYKHLLRKLQFPACAKEALPIIEKLICGRNAPSTKQIDLAMELSAEFLFCETDIKGHTVEVSLKDQSVKELQLIFALANYFKESGDETIKNTVFLSLFGETMSNKRAQTLWKLVSLAISFGYSSLLLAVGTWMQQLGCTSSHSLDLCKHLIKDFFKSSEQQDTLLKLGQLAPRFTANFMTGVAEHYLKVDAKSGFSSPPPMLLEIITNWVCEDTSLCMAAHQTQAALPSGGIAMAAITPFAGLFKWCILAPLTTPAAEYAQVEHLYSKLYLGLLKNLLEVKPSPGPPTAMSAQHLAQVVPPIAEYINKKQIAAAENQLLSESSISNFQDQFNKARHAGEQKNFYSDSSIHDKKALDQEFTNMQQYFDNKLDSIFGYDRKSMYNTESDHEMIIDEEVFTHSEDNIVTLDSLSNFDASLNYDRAASMKFKDLFFKKYQFMLEEINERLDNKYNKIYLDEKMIEVKTELAADETYIEDKLLDVALERLAEAMQISIAVKCMYGSKPYLFSQIETLPHNQLLTLILKSLRAQSL